MRLDRAAAVRAGRAVLHRRGIAALHEDIDLERHVGAADRHIGDASVRRRSLDADLECRCGRNRCRIKRLAERECDGIIDNRSAHKRERGRLRQTGPIVNQQYDDQAQRSEEPSRHDCCYRLQLGQILAHLAVVHDVAGVGGRLGGDPDRGARHPLRLFKLGLRIVGRSQRVPMTGRLNQIAQR